MSDHRCIPGPEGFNCTICGRMIHNPITSDELPQLAVLEKRVSELQSESEGIIGAVYIAATVDELVSRGLLSKEAAPPDMVGFIRRVIGAVRDKVSKVREEKSPSAE